MDRKSQRVLVVDDEAAMREVLEARLDRWGYASRCAGSVAEAEAMIEAFDPQLVLSDLVLPDGTGIDLLHSHTNGTRRFVVLTAYGTVDTAVRAMKGGAVEFLTKPIDYVALKGLLDAHLVDAEPESAPPASEQAAARGEARLLGSSAEMCALRRQLSAVAPSTTSVMLVGESGTGKELAARAIHEASSRASGPFVTVNAAAIPAELVEGEFFGHSRGAFTGADHERPGLFEQAHGGTLFLDEITEMPLALQPKLLRVLEDGRVRRLGSSRELACDVRVVAATNRDPSAAVESGRLRVDLYHRLCVFRVDLPALRERPGDIAEIAQAVLAKLAERHGRGVPSLDADALAKLGTYSFPGNVRELRNVLERALVLARGERIGPEHLGALEASAPVARTSGITLPAGVTASDAERILILETLKRSGNNKAEAARRLGLDVKTIRNKLKSFGQLE